MVWSLAPEVHVATVDEDLVFLDAREGTYACLPGAAPALRMVGAGVIEGLPDLLSDLTAAGLVVSGRASRRFGSGMAAPVSAALSRHSEPPNRDQVRRMIAAGVLLLIHYRGRSFAHLLAIAAKRALGPVGDEIPPGLAADVAAFRHMLPWVPFQGVCLFRSFMLLNLLRLGGRDAQWVFGVRTWPFSAHCWLQIGPVVLDDDLDAVAGYRPILTV